ncbi:MAG: hypothetical protein VYC39_19695 [Myxococcota bacterium]|nr:hypothetical protein [Myxococcota bacterium]
MRLLLVPFEGQTAKASNTAQTEPNQPRSSQGDSSGHPSRKEMDAASTPKIKKPVVGSRLTPPAPVVNQSPKRALKPWEKMAANYPGEAKNDDASQRGPEEPPPIEWDEIAGPDQSPNNLPTHLSARGSAAPSQPEAQEEKPQRRRPAAQGERSFADFVKIIKKQRPTLSGTLTLVRPLQFEAGKVLLGCESAFDLSTISSPTVHSFLQEALKGFFRQETTLEVERVSADVPKEGTKMPQTLDEAAISVRQQKRYELIRQAKIHPAVKAIREELNAEVGRVRILSPDLEG